MQMCMAQVWAKVYTLSLLLILNMCCENDPKRKQDFKNKGIQGIKLYAKQKTEAANRPRAIFASEREVRFNMNAQGAWVFTYLFIYLSIYFGETHTHTCQTFPYPPGANLANLAWFVISSFLC